MLETQTAESMTVYVGTYTHKGSQGIYAYTLDPVTGALALSSVTEDVSNPSFLAPAPGGKFLYAVNELGPEGQVSAFAVEPGGALTSINRQPSQGASPCHVSVDAEGAYVYVANYSSGTAAAYPVLKDGSLGPASDVVQHSGSGPNTQRQEGPHAHSINLSPDGRFAFVADLGIDKLMVYDLAAAPGKLTPHAEVQIAGGSGPRHFTFHPNGRFAYLINELGNSITACIYDAASGTLSEIQTVSTLPDTFDGRNITADIHVAPSGKFLYASNRGHDSIVVYAIDPATGELSYVAHTSTRGRTPRNFALDPSGAFLIVANQDSDNLVVFRVDAATGKLTPAGQEVELSMPVCVKFARP